MEHGTIADVFGRCVALASLFAQLQHKIKSQIALFYKTRVHYLLEKMPIPLLS